jgi:hypothetical protein
MALHEVTNAFIRRLRLTERPLSSAWTQQCRNYATPRGKVREMSDEEKTRFTQETQDLEQASTETVNPEQRLGEYDPVGNARKRKRQLPPSRYIHFVPDYLLDAIIDDFLDTPSVLPDTIVVLSIPINLLPTPIRPRESSFPAPSLSRASSKLTTAHSRQI